MSVQNEGNRAWDALAAVSQKRRDACRHDWRPVPSPHPSVTGQLYECRQCSSVQAGAR